MEIMGQRMKPVKTVMKIKGSANKRSKIRGYAAQSKQAIKRRKLRSLHLLISTISSMRFEIPD